MTTITNLWDKFIQRLNLSQHYSKCGGWTSANPQTVTGPSEEKYKETENKHLKTFREKVDIIILCFMNK